MKSGKKCVLLNDTAHIVHPGSRLVSQNIHRLFSSVGLEIVQKEPYSTFYGDAVWDKVRANRPDLIVIHGEGGLHSSASRPWVRQLLKQTRIVSGELKIPFAVINSVVQDLEPDALDHLRAASAIFVRENLSRDYLRSHDIEAETVPDLSVALPVADFPTRQSGPLVIDSTIKSVKHDLKVYAKDNGLEFISMQPPLSYRGIKRFHNHPIYHRVFSRFAEPERALRRIAQAKNAVTGRFHGVMFCLLTKTPFHAIESNTHKVSATCMDVFGNTERVYPSVEALRDAPSGIAWSKDEMQQVENYLTKGQERAQAMVGKLMELA